MFARSRGGVDDHMSWAATAASSALRASAGPDRKSVVEGKRGDLGGRRIIKKKKNRGRAADEGLSTDATAGAGLGRSAALALGAVPDRVAPRPGSHAVQTSRSGATADATTGR